MKNPFEIQMPANDNKEQPPQDIHVAVDINLDEWPENLPKSLKYFKVDGDYEKMGEGFEIHVRTDGIHFIGFPKELGETVASGAYNRLGNIVRPSSDPVGYIIALIQREPMRYRLEII